MSTGIRTLAIEVVTGMVIAIVLTSTPLMAQSALPTLERSGTIGCLACSGPESLGSVQAVAITPQGGVVLADRDAPMIRRFSAAGSSEAAFGRRGEGPGELGFPVGVAVRPDGRILLGDLRKSWLTELTSEGELVRTIPVPSTVMALNAAPGGDWVAYQVANWSDFTASVHLLSEASDSVATPLPTTAGVLLDENGRGVSGGLFSSAVGPGGIVAAGFGGDRYQIVILNSKGERLREIVREIPRTPRTPEEIAALEDAFRRGPAGVDRDNPEAGARPPEVDPLRHHFPSNAFSWDTRGRLWVRTLRGDEHTTLFDLFGPSGEWLGELTVPGKVSHHATGWGTLATVAADPSTGVQQVVLWSLIG